jgi:hypothetical protein
MILIPSRAATTIAWGVALTFVTLVAASVPGLVWTLSSLDEWECDAQHNAAVVHRKQAPSTKSSASVP